jgi:hypothetical protein
VSNQAKFASFATKYEDIEGYLRRLTIERAARTRMVEQLLPLARNEYERTLTRRAVRDVVIHLQENTDISRHRAEMVLIRLRPL